MLHHIPPRIKKQNTIENFVRTTTKRHHKTTFEVEIWGWICLLITCPVGALSTENGTPCISPKIKWWILKNELFCSNCSLTALKYCHCLTSMTWKFFCHRRRNMNTFGRSMREKREEAAHETQISSSSYIIIFFFVCRQQRTTYCGLWAQIT